MSLLGFASVGPVRDQLCLIRPLVGRVVAPERDVERRARQQHRPDALRVHRVVFLLEAPDELDLLVFHERRRVDGPGDALETAEVLHHVELVADDGLGVHRFLALVLQHRLTQQRSVLAGAQLQFREVDVVEFIANRLGGDENLAGQERALLGRDRGVHLAHPIARIEPPDGVVNLVMFHRMILRVARDVIILNGKGFKNHDRT